MVRRNTTKGKSFLFALCFLFSSLGAIAQPSAEPTYAIEIAEPESRVTRIHAPSPQAKQITLKVVLKGAHSRSTPLLVSPYRHALLAYQDSIDIRLASNRLALLAQPVSEMTPPYPAPRSKLELAETPSA